MPLSNAQTHDLDRAISSVTQDVYRYARFRTMNSQDAEDATMETLHALRKAPEPFLQAVRPTFFAIGVCRRKLADLARKSRLPRLFKRPLSNWVAQSETQIMVGQTLARLSPEHREVLALKYFHEFTQEEIADLLGLSAAAVNSLLQRARAAFAAQSPSREVFE